MKYPKVRASIRAGNSALWDLVDAIQEEAIRSNQPPVVKGDPPPLADGELERLQQVIAEEGRNLSTKRIQALEALGRWCNRGLNVETPITLRNYALSYSQWGMNAGLTPEQTLEKLLSQEKWTVKSFELAIRPPVPEPVKHESVVSRQTVVHSVPAPTPRVEEKQEPEFTEETGKELIRNLLPGVPEEQVNDIFIKLTTNPKDLRSEWAKLVDEDQQARDYAYRLAIRLNNTRSWLKNRRTTVAQKITFKEKMQELTDVTSDELTVLSGGLSDEMIQKALFEAES